MCRLTGEGWLLCGCPQRRRAVHRGYGRRVSACLGKQGTRTRRQGDETAAAGLLLLLLLLPYPGLR